MIFRAWSPACANEDGSAVGRNRALQETSRIVIPVVCLSAVSVSDTRCLLATSTVMLHRTLLLTVDGRRSDPYIHGDIRAWGQVFLNKPCWEVFPPCVPTEHEFYVAGVSEYLQRSSRLVAVFPITESVCWIQQILKKCWNIISYKCKVFAWFLKRWIACIICLTVSTSRCFGKD